MTYKAMYYRTVITGAQYDNLPETVKNRIRYEGEILRKRHQDTVVLTFRR